MSDLQTPRPHLDNPGFLLAHTRLRMARLITRAFRERGHELTPEHWGVMNMLQHCEGQHQTTLAEHLGKDKPNITRILDTLERRGLVTREADPRDRRSHIPLLTEAGRRAHDELSPVVAEIRELVFGSLDPVRYRIFLGVLQDLMLRLDELLATGESSSE